MQAVLVSGVINVLWSAVIDDRPLKTKPKPTVEISDMYPLLLVISSRRLSKASVQKKGDSCGYHTQTIKPRPCSRYTDMSCVPCSLSLKSFLTASYRISFRTGVLYGVRSGPNTGEIRNNWLKHDPDPVSADNLTDSITVVYSYHTGRHFLTQASGGHHTIH